MYSTTWSHEFTLGSEGPVNPRISFMSCNHNNSYGVYGCGDCEELLNASNVDSEALMDYEEAYTFDTWSNFESDYEVLEEIGKGAYGRVAKVLRNADNATCACKFIELQPGAEFQRRIFVEAKIVSMVKHANVVGAVDVRLLERKVNDEGTLALVLPLFDTTLASVIECPVDNPHPCANQQYDEVVVCDIIWQLLVGLGYLHSNGVLHRDLKPENVLVKGLYPNWRIAITDFNSSSCATDVDHERYLCTRTYRAPEISKKGYTTAADMFSIGIIMAEAFRGSCGGLLHSIPSARSEKGYPSREHFKVQAKFTWGRIQQLLEHQVAMALSPSECALGFMRWLLHPCPEARPSVSQALQHPWFRRHKGWVERPLTLTRVKDTPLELGQFRAKIALGEDDLQREMLDQLPSWRDECARRVRFESRFDVEAVPIRRTTVPHTRPCDRIRVNCRILRLLRALSSEPTSDPNSVTCEGFYSDSTESTPEPDYLDHEYVAHTKAELSHFGGAPASTSPASSPSPTPSTFPLSGSRRKRPLLFDEEPPYHSCDFGAAWALKSERLWCFENTTPPTKRWRGA